MEIQIGEVNKFIVKRETDISYTLTPESYDLTTYIFLHFNQATRKLEIGEKIDAFLYYDGKRRLCATMERPLITTSKYDFVEVVSVNQKVGVFVNIGISKDILLSNDFLPSSFNRWPKIGDYLPCILNLKANQMTALIITKDIINNKVNSLEIGESYNGTVIKVVTDGYTICTPDFHFIFIHSSLTRKKYRIGEIINVKIININKNNEYNGSLIEQKELARLSDSDIILNYLQKLGGIIPLGNASTPEQIQRYFNMSKSAFKRAVGALYKKQLIIIEENKIILK